MVFSFRPIIFNLLFVVLARFLLEVFIYLFIYFKGESISLIDELKEYKFQAPIGEIYESSLMGD